jgi:hypothetical protein
MLAGGCRYPLGHTSRDIRLADARRAKYDQQSWLFTREMVINALLHLNAGFLDRQAWHALLIGSRH